MYAIDRIAQPRIFRPKPNLASANFSSSLFPSVALLHNGTPRDVARNYELPLTNGGSGVNPKFAVVGPEGTVLDLSWSTDGFQEFRDPGFTAVNFSILQRIYISSTSMKGAFFVVGDAQTGGYALGVGAATMDAAGNNLIGLYENVRWITTGITLPVGWHTAGLVGDANGFPTIYLDGKPVYSDSSGAPNPTIHYGSPNAFPTVGGYDATAFFGSTRYFSGKVSWTYGWHKHALSADEVRLISADPNVIFDTVQRRVWFGTDAAATTPTASGTATGEAGARATDTGAKIASSTPTGRAGARATTAGGKIAASPVTAEAGLRATDAGAKTASSSPVGRAGARATDAGAKTAVSTVTASAGARATDAGVKTANAGTVGTTGARTTATGTKIAAAGTHGTAGLEGYGSSSGPVAAGAVVGTLGARAQCSGTAIRSGSTIGRVGARAIGAGVATRANVVVGSVGAREQCAGTRTATGAARGSAGLRGFVSNALPPPPDPVPNNRECEADYSLAAMVVWPVDDTPEDQSGRVYDFSLPTKPSWL